MAQRGGSIRELSINGRLFPVAADQGATIILGGWSNQVEPNGDSSVRVIQTRMAPRIEGLQVAIDHRRGDQDFLQDLEDSGELVPVVITLVDNTRKGGNLTLVDTPGLDTQNATCGITMAGQGKIRQQT